MRKDASRVRENATRAHFVRVGLIFARLPWGVNAVDFLVSIPSLGWGCLYEWAGDVRR